MEDLEERAAEDVAARSSADLVVVTGMSGAGRSEAIHTFEDLGYFCIDNLPPRLIKHVVELTEVPESRIDKIAVACDVRGMQFFDELAGALDDLEKSGCRYQLVFLEAEEKTLVQRFKTTRRRHPLAEGGSVQQAIRTERQALQPFRGRADLVIDTTNTTPQQLRDLIRTEFQAGCPTDSLMITVSSFGFKYGMPADADIVMDVRFLPNPYYNKRLKPLTGLDRKVQDYVLGQPETDEFLDKWFGMLDSLAPGYLREGKSHLYIALGCTGGQHRSVTLAEKTAEFMRKKGFKVSVSHRDIAKDRERR